MLKAIAQRGAVAGGTPPAKMRRLLVAACLTCSNAAQLERDLKSMTELWRKRSKKLTPEKLAKQMRVSLNAKARGEQGKDALIRHVVDGLECAGSRPGQGKRKTWADATSTRQGQQRAMMPKHVLEAAGSILQEGEQAVQEIAQDLSEADLHHAADDGELVACMSSNFLEG